IGTWFGRAWRWLSLCGDAFAKASRRHANGGPPRECPRHPACSSAVSTRDRRVHLCERSLLASIITPDFRNRLLIGERDPTRARRPRQICSEKAPETAFGGCNRQWTRVLELQKNGSASGECSSS